MRRVISVWFPTFITDQLRRTGKLPQPEGPIAVSAHDGRRRVVASTNAEGQAAGVTAGMSLTQAQALVPGLTVIEHDPGRDAIALHAVALACLRYAPLVAVDPADGVWIDVTGCTELAGGERALLASLLEWLDHARLTAHAAMDRAAAKEAFAGFIAGKSLTANQIDLVDMIAEHLTENGVMDAGRLYESPYTDLSSRGVDGLFSPDEVDEMCIVLDSVRLTAAA